MAQPSSPPKGLCAWRTLRERASGCRCPTTCCASFAKIRRPPSPPLRRGQTTSRESGSCWLAFTCHRLINSDSETRSRSRVSARHHVTPVLDSQEIPRPRGPTRRSRGLRVVPDDLDEVWRACYQPRPRRPWSSSLGTSTDLGVGSVGVVFLSMPASRSDACHRRQPCSNHRQDRKRQVSLAEADSLAVRAKPVVKNDIGILFQRKPGGYRKPDDAARLLSTIGAANHAEWFQQIWTIGGASWGSPGAIPSSPRRTTRPNVLVRW